MARHWNLALLDREEPPKAAEAGQRCSRLPKVGYERLVGKLPCNESGISGLRYNVCRIGAKAHCCGER